MNEEDRAWLAGFLEGEGWFGTSHHHARKHKTLVVSAASTDEDVLIRAWTIAGCGHIYKKTRKEPYKQVWEWKVMKRADVLALMHTVRPQMGERRGGRIDELLEEYDVA